METALDTATTALIEEHVRRLLRIMNFSDAQVTCTLPNPETMHLNIEAGEIGRLLIGPQGQHLLAFQHIMRCLLRKQITTPIRVLVDVNGYRLRREQTLLGIAEETARRAKQTGRTVVMSPMSAADRRAIHSALANHKDVRTESLGDEPNRRVVVRPVFL